jgi:hypothetical protein
VLGQKFPDTQGRVALRTVVVQKPGTGRPFVRPFPKNCISKALQNGYVDSLIHGLALEKKLVIHQTLRVQKAISIVFTFDRTCLAFFGRGDDGVFYRDSTLFLRMLVVAFRSFLWPSYQVSGRT